MTPRKPTRAKQLGVSDEEYSRLLAAQGGHCALCPNTPKRLKKDGTPYRLHADHDHGSPDHRVRGLLCWKCNDALRTWVTAAWLRKAAAYLEGNTPLTRRYKLPADLVTKPLVSLGGVRGQESEYRRAPKIGRK